MSNTSFDIKKIIDKVIKVLISILVAFVCIIAFFLLYYIISAQIHANDENYKPNISLYTIVSPSMDPIIKVYDVVVNKKVKSPNEISVGDIITYVSTNPTSEGMTITHRVIEVEGNSEGEYAYRTQGDNNSAPDATYVTFDNVIGKEILIIPGLGKIQFLLANKKGWLFLLLIPILAYILKDIYKIIELYGLRRKVDKVAGIIEEPDYVKKRHEKERKERIIKELKKVNSKGDKYIKSELEGNGFLEPYSENIVSVGVVSTSSDNEVENKKQEKEKIEKEPKTSEENNKKIKTQTEKVVIKDNIEILDTDELSSVIKRYTEKIAELDKAIIQMDSKKENVDNFVEKNDYLIGDRIKVLSMETAKKSKKVKKDEKDIPIEKIEIKSASLYNKPKQPKKIERPESVDIKSLNQDINPVKNVKNNQESKESKNKKLNLNPNTVKKIKRNNYAKNKPKTKKIVTKKPSHNKYKIQNKNKNKFIRIEKIK